MLWQCDHRLQSVKGEDAAGQLARRLGLVGLDEVRENRDIENVDRRSSVAGAADQHGAIPEEVPAPTLTSGVEKEDRPPRDRVTSGQIARLGKIPILARPAQVVCLILTPVLPGDDMLNVEAV